MVNKRFLELAKRLGNKELPKVEAVPKVVKPAKATPELLVQPRFLEGDFGRQVNEEIQSRYRGVDALSKSSFEDGVIKGSNPFYVVAVNEVIRPEGLRTATPADLGNIIDNGILDLKDFYEDSALVLRNQKEPNKYLAQNIAKQIKARQKLKYSVMIPLNGLDLVVDGSSDYGLAFKLREDARLVFAPLLDHENDQRSFSKADENGLPIFDDNGDKTLYTRENGLTVLYRSRDLGLFAGNEGLAYSDANGRVVVCGGATQK